MLSTDELIKACDLSPYKLWLNVNKFLPLDDFEVALDVEHDEQGNLVGIGLYQGTHQSYYYTVITDELKAYIEKAYIVAHNGVSDLEMLRIWGINVQNSQLVWDTMLMGHILDSSLKTYGLKDMASRELMIEYPSYTDIVGKHKGKTKLKPACNGLSTGCCDRVTLDRHPIELVARYNALDCYVTFLLYQNQKTKGNPLSYFKEVEQPASVVFHEMECRGVRIDRPYLKELGQNLTNQRLEINDSIKQTLGDINLNSPKQLLGALNAKKIYPWLKSKPSIDKRALDRYKTVPVVESLLKYSELDTLVSSFVRPYLERETEILKPHFKQTGTRTGRPSCSNPNLLQIPRRTANGQLLRRMFIPRAGMLMGDCDFGQIEPRVLAHLSQDAGLLKLFNDGIDFHSFTSERLGISRDRAKVLNLSVGYRATFKSVSEQMKCSEHEAQQEIDKWWNLFPGLRRWQEKLIWESRKTVVCVTMMGRKISCPDLNHGNQWRREGAERQLINNITQGSAAEIMKMAMIKIRKEIPYAGLLCQVYDELLFEDWEESIKDTFNVIKACMENAYTMRVPLVVDGHIGPNWSECK